MSFMKNIYRSNQHNSPFHDKRNSSLIFRAMLATVVSLIMKSEMAGKRRHVGQEFLWVSRQEDRVSQLRMDLLGGALQDHWSWLFASRLRAVVTKARGAFGPEGWGHGSRRSSLRARTVASAIRAPRHRTDACGLTQGLQIRI